MKKNIVVAGTILADVVKVVETYPEKGMLAPISSITQAVGGCVPNTGIDLKKIDPELTVRAAGRVGHDDYGNFIADELKHAGLDISCMIRSTARTSFSDVVSVRETGERTFFHYEAGGQRSWVKHHQPDHIRSPGNCFCRMPKGRCHNFPAAPSPGAFLPF